jgi:hypothetical protein
VGLWTQRLSLSWWSSVRYFRLRFDVLERYEDEGWLWGARVADDVVGARLGDPSHVIEFGPSHMRAYLLNPDADAERLLAALRVLIETVEPKLFANPTFSFQWVIPIAGTYEDVRKRAAASFLPNALSPVTDLAAWLDGDLPDRRGKYYLECGVVEAIEVPPRLAREVGRFMVLRDPNVPSSLWPIETLPPIAFFCDMHCEVADVGSASEFFSQWGETRERAEGVISSLMNRFDLSADE